MKTLIGFLVWLTLRAFTIVMRRPSVTFYNKKTGAPYLTRWPIATAEPWPDPAGRTAGRGWYLHKIVASDHERELHNHPAPGFAIVLRGGYHEWRVTDPRKLRNMASMFQRACAALGRKRWRGPMSSNLLTHLDFHRVELPPVEVGKTWHGERPIMGVRPSWSLFYFGDRSGGGWGFLRDDGTVRRAPHNDGNTGVETTRDDEVVL